MYRKEYQTWLILGGTVDFLTVIDDVRDLIKQTELYKNFPNDMPLEQKQAIIDRTTLYIISQDYARLLQLMHSTKMALNNDQVEKAQDLLKHLFDE